MTRREQEQEAYRILVELVAVREEKDEWRFRNGPHGPKSELPVISNREKMLYTRAERLIRFNEKM